MAIRFTRSSDGRLDRLLAAAAHDSLTYAPVGMSRTGEVPAGFRLQRWSQPIGDAASWERACAALAGWQVQRGSGLTVRAAGPPATGANVAMCAPLPVGFVDVVCRVVAVDDEPDRFGFTYGTLSNHPECGEESFWVVRNRTGDGDGDGDGDGVGDGESDGIVSFQIVAVSRPRMLLSRMAGPIARRLQAAATERYVAAMQRAANPGG